jgi:hypothetical protein
MDPLKAFNRSCGVRRQVSRRTLTVNNCQTVSCDVEPAEGVNGSDVGQRRYSEEFARGICLKALLVSEIDASNNITCKLANHGLIVEIKEFGDYPGIASRRRSLREKT